MDAWIDIMEFSVKYGVSASTLRRRIRTNTVPFKMERGKYLIKDSADALDAAPLFSRKEPHASASGGPRQQVRNSANGVHDPVNDLLNSDQVMPVRMQDDYNNLLDENRRLKAQIAELETLVKVLESELTSKTYAKEMR